MFRFFRARRFRRQVVDECAWPFAHLYIRGFLAAQCRTSSPRSASLSAPGDGYPGLTATRHDPRGEQFAVGARPRSATFTRRTARVQRAASNVMAASAIRHSQVLPVNYINFAEEEDPPSGDRLLQSAWLCNCTDFQRPRRSNLLRITASGENCGDFVSVSPAGRRRVDINPDRKGGRPNTHGDPHIRTIDGTHYDFQSAGEFTLLRGESIEIQARHTPVETASPLPPNAPPGSAVARRSTPQPRSVSARTASVQLSGQPDPSGMTARQRQAGRKAGPTRHDAGGGASADHRRAESIEYGARMFATVAASTLVPRHRCPIARANFGIMGAIAPRNWLPALPDNSWLGQRPAARRLATTRSTGQFADAWRVTNTTTLFDYARKSTARMLELAQVQAGCSLPRPWAPPVAPQQPIALDAARKICGGIVDASTSATASRCFSDG